MQKVYVNVVEHDRDMKEVSNDLYPLREWCNIFRNNLWTLITDVEDVIYRATNGSSKNDWTDDTWAKYCAIKHKLLDKAGEIERLPDNLRLRNESGETDGQGICSPQE